MTRHHSVSKFTILPVKIVQDQPLQNRWCLGPPKILTGPRVPACKTRTTPVYTLATFYISNHTLVVVDPLSITGLQMVDRD